MRLWGKQCEACTQHTEASRICAGCRRLTDNPDDLDLHTTQHPDLQYIEKNIPDTSRHTCPTCNGKGFIE